MLAGQEPTDMAQGTRSQACAREDMTQDSNISPSLGQAGKGKKSMCRNEGRVWAVGERSSRLRSLPSAPMVPF